LANVSFDFLVVVGDFGLDVLVFVDILVASLPTLSCFAGATFVVLTEGGGKGTWP